MAFAETAPAPRALRVEWRQSGGRLWIPVQAGSLRADTLDFRIAGSRCATGRTGRARADCEGGWTKLGANRSCAPLRITGRVRGNGRTPAAREPSRGIALRDLTDIELRPRTPHGGFWLLDISARERVAPPAMRFICRISVGDLIVPEGDAGTFTVDVPIAIDGPVTRRARLWVQFTDYADFEQPTRGVPLVLEPGATSATVPFTFTADDIYNPYPRRAQATLLAQMNAVTGDYDGSVQVGR
jgi:hypothetical protein